MVFPPGNVTNHVTDSVSQTTLRKLSFLAASLFFLGSFTSIYVAYQNIKTSNQVDIVPEFGVAN